MCMERRRFSQTMVSEWQTAFVVSHKMPWCALLTAVKNYSKNLENCKTFSSRPRTRQDQMFKTKTSWSKTKTKTFIFVLEAPRDQDPYLEDYITALKCVVHGPCFVSVALELLCIRSDRCQSIKGLLSYLSCVLRSFRVAKLSRRGNSRITTKILKTARLFLQDRDQDQMFKTKTSWSKTKTKTFIFVLEAPRDQDPDLEGYIAALECVVHGPCFVSVALELLYIRSDHCQSI